MLQHVGALDCRLALAGFTEWIQTQYLVLVVLRLRVLDLIDDIFLSDKAYILLIMLV